MNKFKTIFHRSFLLFLVLLTNFCTQHIDAKRMSPLIWDMKSLENTKNNLQSSGDAKVIVELADQYCGETPICIVNQRYLDYAPNEHYYCSMSPYIWPDSVNKGKYIVQDGKANPNYKFYDSEKLSNAARRCEILSKAFYFTRKKKYYTAFINQLRAWFLDDATYMLPNFEYAQVIPEYRDRNNSTGMIDAYFFNTIMESIRLVDAEKKIKRRTMKGLQKWFLTFADWSETMHGKYMREEGKQNISVAYDVTIVNMYLFAGKLEVAKSLADGFAERRIFTQIAEDGTQPEELKRPNAFSYSIYNLTHFLDFCYLVRYWDNDYYSKYGKRIDEALSFLQRYIDTPESFSYPKITDLNSAKKSLNELVMRRDVLGHAVQ